MLPIVLSLKFVEFKDPSTGNPILTHDQVQTVITGVNEVYASCGIRFQVDEYQAVDSREFKLPYHTRSMSELDPIRTPFASKDKLVVINTGTWDHVTMGGANAWTTMPGQSPSGAVLESSVADNAPIVAHELGHYLSLDHVQDPAAMMNPVIYPTSTRITPLQCSEMRKTAMTFHKAAMRS